MIFLSSFFESALLIFFTSFAGRTPESAVSPICVDNSPYVVIFNDAATKREVRVDYFDPINNPSIEFAIEPGQSVGLKFPQFPEEISIYVEYLIAERMVERQTKNPIGKISYIVKRNN